MSSFVGARGDPYGVAYTTSKAGLIMFTRSLAREWARYNINVNAIGPGYVNTPVSARLYDNERYGKRLLSQVPLRRFCEPREVGLLAVYLASDASNYMTGQTIFLDGGFLA